jgi:hypothetical protein
VTHIHLHCAASDCAQPYGLGARRTRHTTTRAATKAVEANLALETEGVRAIRFASIAPRKENEKHAKEARSMPLQHSIGMAL